MGADEVRLSPRVRIGTSYLVIGAAHFASRRFGDAVPKLLLAIQEDPGFPLPYRCLAACYAHMGRLGDARAIVERLRAISPVVVPDTSSCGTQRTESCFCRACAWRRVR